MKKLLHLFLLILTIQFFFTSTAIAQTGKIRGKVLDALTGDPLPGANLIFKEYNIGTAASYDGSFIITNIPEGEHQLTVSYISYDTKEISVNIVKDRVLEIEIELSHQAIVGETVVVTEQASAQVQAMSEQINSTTIKNIVSAKSIQALPESNAAEAVGRLPGISLERSGGEGAKVIIRGLAPKYSKVQIDGVNMAATGEGDRSSDLSMISPYMLDGIEVTKSVMADQEADATGGIVNFRIKQAPEKPTFNAVLEGSYNGLDKSYNNYKASVGGSRRFFDNNFGLYLQFNAEQKNNSSDEFGDRWSGVTYEQTVDSLPVETRGVNAIDADRLIDRLGATVVMDYTLPTTKIKFSNFTSKIGNDRQDYKIAYNYYENGYGRTMTDHVSDLSIMTNSLRLEQVFDNFTIDGGVSYAFSENDVPEEVTLNVIWSDGAPPPFEFIDRNTAFDRLDPFTIPDSLKATNLSPTLLGRLMHSESYMKENELGMDLNFTYKNSISKNFGFQIKFGGKYKHKDKVFDRSVQAEDINFGGSQVFRNMIINLYNDELSEGNMNVYNTPSPLQYYPDFIDLDYNNDGFLGGKLVMDNMPNLEWFRNIDDVAIERGMYNNHSIASVQDDYNGTEDYWAMYVKPEIRIGEDFTIIPGVRYESNRTEYTGYRVDENNTPFLWSPVNPDTVTVVRENNYLLPMIQFFYKPFNWLNFKGGFTKTLQRPNYQDIIPSWILPRFSDFVTWKNSTLRPEQSTNIDFQVSLFSDKIGLFSVGAFHKKIKDMMFYTGAKAIVDTAFYGLPSKVRYKRTGFVLNNENDVLDYGFEVEWKSNFWWLPGLLKGLVVNVNYTRNISEAKYPKTRIIQEYDEFFNLTVRNNDTTYTSRMVLQPDHLFNLTVGYDYKGFSIRWALRYKSNIFKLAAEKQDLRAYSTDFVRHDIAIKQQLPIEGLELFLNINNLTNEYEVDVIRPRINPKSLSSNTYESTWHEEHYGRLASIGLRYRY